MNRNIQPLKAERFMKVALEYIKPYKDVYIYNLIIRDYLEKTEQVDAGYGRWLQHLVTYLVRHYNLKAQPHILDFGCGTGELTVRMNTLGFQAIGIDNHEKHLELARILAKENNLPETIFILNKDNKLPFSDNSFDIITMFSVLEHLSDATLKWLLPELRRVCRGVIYMLVPNKLKIGDDHTGLRFVPWMPKWLARMYIKMHGRKNKYFISTSGSWDVYYRTFSRIKFLFKEYGFNLELPPDNLFYPPSPQVIRLGKTLRLGTKTIFIGLPSPWRLMIKLGWPKQAFYPILNLIFTSTKKGICL